MDGQAVSALLAALLILAIGASVLLRSRSDRMYTSFAAFTFTVSAWHLCTFIDAATNSPVMRWLSLWAAATIPPTAIRFFRIFLARIEPELGMGVPTILMDYPISMAALARPKPEDPRLAERFEVYVCGLELANAFGELTDAAVQRRRFEQDQARKQARYGFSYPIDEDFLAALALGMPPSAGIALGFDRLVMLATGAEDIEDVLWAPVA